MTFSDHVLDMSPDDDTTKELTKLFAIFSALELDIDARSERQEQIVERDGPCEPLTHYLTLDDMRAIAVAIDITTYYTSLLMMSGRVTPAILMTSPITGSFLTSMLFAYADDAGLIPQEVK